MGNNELLEQRARLFGEMRSFTESMSGRRWAAEDEQRWDRMNADYDRLSEQINRGDREDRSRDNGPTVFRTGSEDDPCHDPPEPRPQPFQRPRPRRPR